VWNASRDVPSSWRDGGKWTSNVKTSSASNPRGTPTSVVKLRVKSAAPTTKAQAVPTWTTTSMSPTLRANLPSADERSLAQHVCWCGA